MDRPTTDPPRERLRTPPAERFAGDTHLFRIEETLAQLRGEEHPTRHGHRQKALFHRGPVTTLVFDFDEGGMLAEHTTPGLVTIHGLQGHLQVKAEGETHDLHPGHILILRPGIPHDVHAVAPGAMLLTVHLEQDR
jgi:quercetin dioxygenase-like cupin family protein